MLLSPTLHNKWVETVVWPNPIDMATNMNPKILDFFSFVTWQNRNIVWACQKWASLHTAVCRCHNNIETRNEAITQVSDSEFANAQLSSTKRTFGQIKKTNCQRARGAPMLVPLFWDFRLKSAQSELQVCLELGNFWFATAASETCVMALSHVYMLLWQQQAAVWRLAYFWQAQSKLWFCQVTKLKKSKIFGFVFVAISTR